MSTNNDLNGIVQSIVTTLTSQLSQRPTPAQVSELIRECIEEVQLDFSRTIELCTVIPRTQSVQSGIAADVLSLNFFGTEEPSRTFRSAIEFGPLAQQTLPHGLYLELHRDPLSDKTAKPERVRLSAHPGLQRSRLPRPVEGEDNIRILSVF